MSNLSKSLLVGLAALLIFTMNPGPSFADSVTGDTIITLGEDLSETERQDLLDEMDASDDVEIVTVSNAEEHEYLGNYMSASDIGTKALSSARITPLDGGSGMEVETNNITTVTEGMYANALITAGVEDAEVYVTAPDNVSGTGALTGLMKAYEQQQGEALSEDRKQVASEEMVTTSELAESDNISQEEATRLITLIKQEIAEQQPDNEEEIREVIQNVEIEMNITLTENQTNQLVSLFTKMNNLNIDWGDMQNRLDDASNNIRDVVTSEEAQNFFQRIIRAIESFVRTIVNTIKSVTG